MTLKFDGMEVEGTPEELYELLKLLGVDVDIHIPYQPWPSPNPVGNPIGPQKAPQYWQPQFYWQVPSSVWTNSSASCLY